MSGPADIRQVYLSAAAVGVELVASDSVASRWGDDSALPGFTVGGLAGHLARTSLDVVVAYLDGERPTGELVSVVGYYTGFDGLRDRDSELSAGVRSRGEEFASVGAAGVVGQARSLLADLSGRLPSEPADRALVATGRGMLLDEYLRTRIVEVVVHTDDLAVSVGLDTPSLPAAAYTVTIDTLVGLARAQRGDLAVVRALTRAERDPDHALRVL